MNSANHLLDVALRAVAQTDPVTASSDYELIIQNLSEEHGGDQKEIALALQSLAKQIESIKDADSAYRFKQRTCEVLLILNMEARRSGRKPKSPAPAASATSPVSTIISPSGATAGFEPVSDALVLLARSSVQSDNPEEAERTLTELIRQLENLHAHDQREIAAALKSISKQLEQESADFAFCFKQRSCELMLKLNMAARRRSGG